MAGASIWLVLSRLALFLFLIPAITIACIILLWLKILRLPRGCTMISSHASNLFPALRRISLQTRLKYWKSSNAWKSYSRAIFRQALRQDRGAHTKYQVWRAWCDRVRRVSPILWRDICYPMPIKRTGVIDVGALLALVFWLALVAVGLLTVYPMLARIYDWLSRVF